MPLEMTQRAETTPNVSLRPKTLFAAICSTTVLHSCPGVAPPSFQRDVNLKAETCELAICVHNRTVGGATCELLQADSINYLASSPDLSGGFNGSTQHYLEV